MDQIPAVQPAAAAPVVEGQADGVQGNNNEGGVEGAFLLLLFL